MPNATRHPKSIGNSDVFSSSSAPAAPPAAPSQYDPLITRSTRPRTARRDQFVDGRVDRRVFATDARPREEPGDEEVPRRKSESRCHGGRQINHQGQHEQLLPAEPVGQLAEEQRAEAGTGDVDGGGYADLRRR